MSIPFLKKYLAFARQRFSAPEMTPEATEAIAEYYAELRNSPDVAALPVTVRTLETIIRLACAHAKVRLSPQVEISDVDEVISIVDLILKSDPSATEAGKVPSNPQDNRTKRVRGDSEEEVSSDSDDEVDAEDIAKATARADTLRRRPVSTGTAEDVKKTVLELSSEASGRNANVTGVVAALRAQGIDVDVEFVKSVLQQLEAEDKIQLDGDDFYNVS